jgi:hypothetical protein
MFVDFVDKLYIEDCLCNHVKKFSTNKFSLFAQRQTEIVPLTAASAATGATTFAVFATAIVEHGQFVHGFHLLSNRRLSMELGKKLEAARACHPILLVDDVDQFLGRCCFRCEFDHQLTTAKHNIFLVQGIEGLLAFFADVDQTRLAQDGKMMRDSGLGESNFFNDLIYRQPTAAALAHDFLAGLICNGFGKKNRICFHRRLSI